MPRDSITTARRCAAKWSYEEAAVAKGGGLQPRNPSVTSATAAISSAPSPLPSPCGPSPPATCGGQDPAKSTMPASTGRDGKLLTTSRRSPDATSAWRTIVVRLANRWPDDAIEVQTKERCKSSRRCTSPADRLRRLGKSLRIQILRWMASGWRRSSQRSSERQLSYHGAPRSRRQESGNAIRRPPGRPANLQSRAERLAKWMTSPFACPRAPC